MPKTLRGRLAALLVAILTVGFAVAATIMVLVVQHVLVSRLDAQLRAAGDRFAIALEHNDNDADNADGADGQLPGTLGARLIHGAVTNAAVVGQHDATNVLSAQALAQLARLSTPMNPRTIGIAGLGDYRVIVSSGRDGDLLVTGLPAAPLQHTLDTLAIVVVSIFAVTLMVVVVVSTGLIRVLLGPLSRVAATATVVAELPLASDGVALPHRVRQESHSSELNALVAAFNAMLERVESALRTRDDSEAQLRRFLADASHELRTPIAVIRSHAELAQREDGAVPDAVTHSLQRITAQSQRMGHVVEDLLLLARLDSGRALGKEPVDIVRLALDAVGDARTASTEHHWRLVLPEDPVIVRGDEHSLAQVLANLLANVAAHTPAGTTATLQVCDTGNGVTITVSDDGPGLPPQIVDRAFDRFVRGDAERSAARGSSGLGLPIVAAIVAAHDGSIELHSDEDGTTVMIDLPDAVGTDNAVQTHML